MVKGPNIIKDEFKKNKDKCINLLTNYLHCNGLESLKDLYLTPLNFVSGVHKGSEYGGYLPLSMVGALISVEKFLNVAWSYPGPLSVSDMDWTLLEQYLS